MTTPSKSAIWIVRHARQILNFLTVLTIVTGMFAIKGAVEGDRAGVYFFAGVAGFLLLSYFATRVLVRRHGGTKVSQ